MTNKYTFEINVSKPDKYGNCYAYFTVTNNENGKSKSYQTGWCEASASNEKKLAYAIDNCNIVMKEKLMIRKFNHASKPLAFMNLSGSVSDNIENAETIKKELE